jgi:hypothetical protein
MTVRRRTTKLVAKRHDLHYFKRMSPIRAWQWGLAAVALIGAAVWFGGNSFIRGSTLLSAGPMSNSHAAIGDRCELCHVPVISATRFTPDIARRRHVPDSACLQCHVASPHHPEETAMTPTCGSCHTEHVGAMHLAATADSSCSQCHAKLQPRGGVLQVAASVTSFAGDHPDFRPLRASSDADKRAATSLVFNHAEHLKAGLRGPTGPVSLNCASCHAAALGANGRQGSGIAPVSYAKSCQSCHGLQFDGHTQTEAPHAAPSEVRAFIASKIGEFAETHPQVVTEEIRNWPREAPLPGRDALPPPRTPAEWVANRVAHSEAIVWRERCGLCHRTEDGSLPAGSDLPIYQTVKQPELWFQDAVFSHPAHQAVACAACHTKALISSSEHDDLMPTIGTCRTCHDGRSSPQGPALASGHAESGCFLCHTYHGPESAELAVPGFSMEQLRGR